MPRTTSDAQAIDFAACRLAQGRRRKLREARRASAGLFAYGFQSASGLIETGAGRDVRMTTERDWAGAVGDTWAREWRRTDRSFADLSRHLDAAILAAAPAGPFRALDIGCGAGGTILALSTARPDATIIGVDLSEELVAVARNRLAEVLAQEGAHAPTADLVTGDAVAMAASLAPLDLIFSRHGVMFFDDPVAAFTTFHRACRSGARLVFSCFRAVDDNPWARDLLDAVGAPRQTVAGYAPGPFGFADEALVADVLARAGWRDASAQPVDFRYRAGEGDDPVTDALDFFQRIGPVAPLLRNAEPATRAAPIGRIAQLLEDRLEAGRIDFPAAAWIWSATA